MMRKACKSIKKCQSKKTFSVRLSMPPKLGKKNTAKRRIQIRNYLEKQKSLQRHYANPFDKDEVSSSDDELILPKFEFAKMFGIKPRSKNDEEEDKNDILHEKINLDDADYLISSLKLPKKVKIENTPPIRTTAITHISKADLEALKAESEELARLKRRESQDQFDEEEDEPLI